MRAVISRSWCWLLAGLTAKSADNQPIAIVRHLRARPDVYCCDWRPCRVTYERSSYHFFCFIQNCSMKVEYFLNNCCDTFQDPEVSLSSFTQNLKVLTTTILILICRELKVRGYGGLSHVTFIHDQLVNKLKERHTQKIRLTSWAYLLLFP